jgi:uncharacterized repeat protein (TIGR02543 family)
VSFNSDGGTAVGEQVVGMGAYASKPQSPSKENHKFLGWYDGAVRWDFGIMPINSNITLTAKWEPYPTYSVVFDSAGGSSVDTQYIVEGGFAEEPAKVPTMANHRFIGWYVGESLWIFDENPITGNITLTAKWEAFPTFTVSFVTNCDTVIEDQHLISGGKVVMPDNPVKAGARFLGWYNANVLWDFENNTVSANTVLTAKWTNIYTVTFETGDSELVIPPQEIVEGGKVTKPQTDPTLVGKVFDCWCVDDAGTPWNFDTDSVSENITLTAKYKNVYTVTFDTDGGTEVAAQSVIDGEAATKPNAPSKENFTFEGWYIRGSEEEWDFSTPITGDTVLVAKWGLRTPIHRW